MTEHGIPGLRRSRASVIARAELKLGSGRLSVPVLDLSVSGARMQRLDGLTLADGEPLRLDLEGGGRRVDDLPAHVARVGSDDFAVEFGLLAEAVEAQLTQLIDATMIDAV